MSNLIKVLRYKFAKDWTLSKYHVQGVLFGFGVEDETRTAKVKGETAIPFGVYALGCRYSPKFSKYFYWSNSLKKLITKEAYQKLTSKGDYKEHELIWVMNVPAFEYVLIHWGNTDDDTDGCYIVGSTIGIINGQEGVMASKINYIKMYQKCYPLIKAGGQTISYEKE